MDNTNFRIQDFQKFILPGTTILGILLFLYFQNTNISEFVMKYKDFTAPLILVFLILSYLIGYFNDYLGSLFEILYYCFFKKPSLKLINNTSKCKLSNKEKILEFICDKMRCNTTRSTINYTKESAAEIFKFANVLKDRSNSSSSKDRLMEYYFLKIFSRNFTACFTSIFILFFSIVLNCSVNKYLVLFCMILLAILSLFRWKTHAIYYSRQVFYVASEDMRW
jgi:uncharacterized integral membrane protein